MKYLVTGAAGFIGSATVKKLTQLGHHVIGIDNLNHYYDVSLKLARLKNIEHSLFEFIQQDLTNYQPLVNLFAQEKFDRVIHLAAQAGVRYSIDHPQSYIDANIQGYLNILEACRQVNIPHLIYASSSSVYGLNQTVPFSTSAPTDQPVSLYAATKKSNELMAHCYSHLYDLPTTGLRFFTVYGPWGRPDMAPFIFTKKIINGEPIDINNHGNLWRDFTHIDDIVEGVVRVANVIPTNHGTTHSAPYRLYNIGLGAPINLMDFIKSIESELNMVAKKNFRAMQPGDVYKTYADTESLFNVIDYRPRISVEAGISDFINWYKTFYQL